MSDATVVTTEAADDDFDTAFNEAIATAGSGEPTKPAVAAVEGGDDATAAAEAAAKAAAAAVDTTVDADEAADAAKKLADDAAAKKVADDAAAAKVVTDAAEKKAAEEAAAKKVADDAAAAALIADPVAAAAAKKVADDAAAAKAVTDAAEKKAAEEAAAKAVTDAAAKKVTEDAAAKKAAEEAAAAEIKDPVWAEEDDKAWKTFEKEWPEHAANVTKKMAHNVALIEARFARTMLAVVTKVYEDFAPVVKGYQEVSTNSFRNTVLAKHADYDALSPKLEGWIKSQPAYLQESMLRVYNGGSADELIDLVGRYKTANGVSESSATTQATTDDAAKKAAEKAAALAATEAARKLAAASTRPVAGARATPSTTGVDPNDYDSAFDEAVAAQTA